MITLVISIFVASVLGSLHCAGMCGAFLAIALNMEGLDGTRRAGAPSAFQLQSAYHLGRLTTYLMLGLLAGAAGQLLDLSSTLAGVQPVAAALAGSTLAIFGLVSLLRLLGFSIRKLPAPMVLQNLLRAGHRRAFAKPPVWRAATIGLLTTLLPCGWLYAFAITAAGTAHPLKGMLVMGVFWVGTLPVLIALGAGLRGALGPLGRRVPAMTCLALMAVGIMTLINRSALDPAAMARGMTAEVSAGPAAAPNAATTLPCCDVK